LRGPDRPLDLIARRLADLPLEPLAQEQLRADGEVDRPVGGVVASRSARAVAT